MSDTHELATLIEHAAEMTWLQRAACRDLDLERLDLFFVDAGRTLSSEAAAICGGCEVRVECLSHAYDHEINAGYFGGLSSAKRRALSREQAIDLIRR